MKKERRTEAQNINQESKKFFSARVRRDFRYGTNAVVLIAAALVLFVVANLILESFGTALTVDMTREKLYSIGEVTDKNLKALNKDIEIIALYDEVQGQSDTNSVEVMKILALYDGYDRVTVSYKDPDKYPSLIRDTVGETEAASYSEGDYIVKCGDKTRRIAASDMFVYETVNYFYRQKTGIQVEQKLTSAILFVTSEEYPVVYCDTGLGEKSRSEFTMIFNRLEQEGCDIQDLNIKEITEIPKDAAVLVFLSPKADLTEREAAMIEQWLIQTGGQIVFCADEDLSWTPFTNFNRILSEQFGLAINSDVLHETNDSYKIVSANNDKAFKGISVSKGPLANSSVYPVYLQSTRSVEVLSVDTDTTYIENYAIIQTMDTAKSVSGLADKKERTGVHVVAAAAMNSTHKNVIHGAVFGSTAYLTDAYYEQYGLPAQYGLAIFVQTVDWMVSEYNENEGGTIKIKTYDAASTKVVVDKGQGNLLAIVAMLVIPAIIIGCGIVVWIRRRHL